MLTCTFRSFAAVHFHWLGQILACIGGVFQEGKRRGEEVRRCVEGGDAGDERREEEATGKGRRRVGIVTEAQVM